MDNLHKFISETRLEKERTSLGRRMRPDNSV
jgi:hypothetical protein